MPALIQQQQVSSGRAAASSRAAAPRIPLVLPTAASARRRPVCRYTTGAGRDPRGDRWAETVLYTAPDPDGPALTPACQSVMMALLEKRLPFRHVLVRPDADQSDFVELYEAAAGAPPLGTRPSPPLLADCGSIIASTPGGCGLGGARVILEYLCERYRAVGAGLLPSNAGAAAVVRLFVDVFSEALVAPYRRFARAKGAADVAQARRDFLEGWRRVDAFLLAHSGGAAAGFDALDAGAEMLFGQHRAFVVRRPDARVSSSVAAAAGRDDDDDDDEGRDEGTLDGSPAAGELGAADPVVDRDAPASAASPPPRAPPSPPPQGAYLLGRAYSLAEVAATPHVARMAALLPALRGFDLAAELRREGLERSASWVEACLARPSAVATDPTADEMVGGLAAAEWASAL